ncbi:HU family DNA-binding protein [Vibrio owensii]|uniref:HU family DNA-binding protein n=1 Tax=Vibrio harveyi group TaxID=717610 RepID=UPI003CC57D6B
MNKTELVAQVQEKGELTKAQASKAVDAVFSSITDALRDGDNVQLIGFGTFEVRTRAARTGRNPKTGEEIQIAESKNVALKAGKQLKDALN